MEKLLYYFKSIDDHHIEAHFPREAWVVILEAIDHLQLLNPSFTNHRVTNSEFDELKIQVSTALSNETAPIFNRSGYEVLEESLRLTDRRFPISSYKVLSQIEFTQQQCDILDQIDLHVWWNEDGTLMSLPEYEQFIYVNRFDHEMLNKRTELFDLFGSLGFNNTKEGWSGNKRYIPDDYFHFEGDFYWKTSIGFLNAAVLEAEIGIIVKPTDMTFLAMVSFGCVVGCCARPLKTFEASTEGVDDMMREIEKKAYQLEVQDQ